jgi:hypothetical protein
VRAEDSEGEGSAGLGQMPVLCLTSAFGLLLMALADSGLFARTSWAPALLWPGFLLVVAPISGRLVSLSASRQERIALIVLLGLALCVARVMQSPFAFTESDEFIHLYNLEQILKTGSLFSPNPVLPVSAYYPGLEAAASALAMVCGLQVYSAGLVLIGAARLVLMLSLFLFYERFSRSARVAGIAAALYASNPNFLFFDADFSYESFALPIALMVLFVVARRDEAQDPGERAGFAFLAVLAMAAVAVTHHLSSYFLALFLLVWAGLALLQRASRREPFVRLRRIVRSSHVLRVIRRLALWSFKVLGPFSASRVEHESEPWESGGGPGGLALVGVILPLVWLLLIASATVGYLQNILGRALESVIQMIRLGVGSRPLFVSAAGPATPLWERLAAIGSVALSLLALPPGLMLLLMRYRRIPLAALIGTAAVAYFAMLGFRFTSDGWQVGNRATEYLFLGLALVLALVTAELWGPSRPRVSKMGQLVLVAAFSVLFVGGIITGWPPQLVRAQPYAIEAGSATILPEGVAVAQWAGSVLGPGHPFAADNANAGPLLAYGSQQVVSADNIDVGELLWTPGLSRAQVATLHERHIQYIAVDRRATSVESTSGYYASRSGDQGPAGGGLTAPAVSEKFDQAPGANRILDAGDITIYDLGALSHGMSAN